jgi:hypothetical protein
VEEEHASAFAMAGTKVKLRDPPALKWRARPIRAVGAIARCRVPGAHSVVPPNRKGPAMIARRLAAALLLATVAAAPAAAQRDPGLNQPGAVGNRGVAGVGVGAPGVGVVDPGINQPGAMGNRGVATVGVGAPGVGAYDPGINQPGAAGNVPVAGAARRTVRRY